jgi:hypothetical protein
VTSSPSADDADDRLLVMLRTIRDRDVAQLDNAALGRFLGWTDEMTAASLVEAKDRLLIWGIRVGGRHAPSFEEIELTVQGRRFVSAAAS